MSYYSAEEIFTAGWDAFHEKKCETARDAYTEYRYKQLKDTEGLAAANEWAEQRKRADKPEELLCPDCQGAMIARNGQYGKFWGCASYPQCKGTRDSQGRSKQDREEWKRKNDPSYEEGTKPNSDMDNSYKTTFKKG